MKMNSYKICTAPLKCLSLVLTSALISCGGSNDAEQALLTDNPIVVIDNTDNAAPQGQNSVELSDLDEELIAIIEEKNISSTPLAGRDLPSIEDPIADLGKKLFFSKSLGGDFDSACVSCHHPALGGTDALSLPVGVGALDPDHLGQGREHINGLPNVPRNSPSNFNVGLFDTGLFFDSRVESLGKEALANGSESDIRTPDSAFNAADPNAGVNLVAAQARFPVTSAEEMKSDTFESNSSNDEIRAHLAARIGNYGIGTDELERNEWLAAFQAAFASTDAAEDLITFDNIAFALGEYQRSLVFVDNAWQDYVNGNLDAISNDQKRGAILFFTDANQNGGGCGNCHSGSLFSDQNHHIVAFPHIGHGKGDGINGTDDFGRERETGEEVDRYRFRTPSLLNIALTAPYGHAGAYETLSEVLEHYNNPNNSVDDFFDAGGVCELEQFENIPDCENLYPDSEQHSNQALSKLQEERRNNTALFQNTQINNNERQDIEAFLHALTDPCAESRECLSPWIADQGDNLDDMMLEATGDNGTL